LSASDRYRIDGHKLIFHPERVAQWRQALGDWEKAKSIYPIYMEISPIGICNHRCVFCAVDFVGYQNKSLDPAIFRGRLGEMAKLGVKSLMFAGEGEPALWKPLPETLDYCTKMGIDTALTTNMSLFTEKNMDSFVRNCSWIKVSMNAGTRETYSEIHRTKAADFDRVVKNFKMCDSLRQQKGYDCTMGAQMLLLPENAEEAYTLASIIKDAGGDYLVIKPYSQHLRSMTRKYEGLDYSRLIELGSKLQELNDDNFSVIFRAQTMLKLQEERREYETCYSTPFFWAYVMSDGCVYACSAFLEDDRFNLGNIHHNTFKEIWEGEKRRACLEAVQKLDIGECRRNCRMDDINRYLWQLSHPDRHVNFI
jgi:radical SAM protein with 4Fe4S-binding SPASM domain